MLNYNESMQDSSGVFKQYEDEINNLFSITYK